MLTANAIVGSRERYLQEGFYDFLSKPILPEKLDQMQTDGPDNAAGALRNCSRDKDLQRDRRADRHEKSDLPAQWMLSAG